MSNEEQWNIKLELVAQYIEQNDNRPSHHDKSNEIKHMGNWICNQINKYKKKQILCLIQILILIIILV